MRFIRIDVCVGGSDMFCGFVLKLLLTECAESHQPFKDYWSRMSSDDSACGMENEAMVSAKPTLAAAATDSGQTMDSVEGGGRRTGGKFRNLFGSLDHNDRIHVQFSLWCVESSSHIDNACVFWGTICCGSCSSVCWAIISTLR